MSKRRRVAVVGVGLIGEQHAEVWNEHPRCRVTLVCDLNAERAQAVAAKLGCDWTTSIDDVVASDVELCSVVTPDFAHREPAVRLAEAGKHLLIEKPLATSSADGLAILRAARHSGIKATVSLGNRWMPQIQQAREAVQAGEIGELAMFYARLSDTIDVPTKMLSWAGRSGPQWFLFSHTMDYMRWILGQEPIEVYAVGQKKILPDLGIDAFDAIQAMVKFERCFGTLETAGMLPAAWPSLIESEITIYGSKGRLHVDRLRQGFELTSDVAGRHMYARPSLWDRYPLPPTYFGALRNLVAAVDGTDDLRVSLEDGVATVALIEATERSIATGRPVDPRPLMALA